MVNFCSPKAIRQDKPSFSKAHNNLILIVAVVLLMWFQTGKSCSNIQIDLTGSLWLPGDDEDILRIYVFVVNEDSVYLPHAICYMLVAGILHIRVLLDIDLSFFVMSQINCFFAADKGDAIFCSDLSMWGIWLDSHQE